MERSMEQRLRCYLKDCGCSAEQAAEYLKMAASGNTRDQLIFMKRQRNMVMDQLHTATRQVDCIDYVIRELEQEVNHHG